MDEMDEYARHLMAHAYGRRLCQAMLKYGTMHETMKEFKEGKLHSGSKEGPKVTDRNQAIAIGLKQSGQSNQ